MLISLASALGFYLSERDAKWADEPPWVLSPLDMCMDDLDREKMVREFVILNLF